MIIANGHKIQPTIFPDKTSQVWKLPKSVFQPHCSICWDFESESEVFHLMQLLDLLSKEEGVDSVHIHMPTLPYARQDKEIENCSTFALRSIGRMLCDKRSSFMSLSASAFDAHSKILGNYLPFSSESPLTEICAAIYEFDANCLCFPDSGARERYSDAVEANGSIATITLEKTRNQTTGEITGLAINSSGIMDDHQALRVLIVDDICDGGRTFIEASKLLHSRYECEVGLYVSHGIFSKGTQVLYDAGISQIYTREGKVNEPVLPN